MLLKMDIKDMKEEIKNLKQSIISYIQDIIPEYIKQYEKEIRNRMDYKENKYYDQKTNQDITKKIYI